MAQFLVDADMPARTAEALRAKGYDAVDIRDLGMGFAPDAAIFDLAQKEGRAVITRDLGFAALAADRPSHQGVLLLRFGGLRSPAIIGGLQAAMESLSATTTDLTGAVVVIEPGRVRTRRLP